MAKAKLDAGEDVIGVISKKLVFLDHAVKTKFIEHEHHGMTATDANLIEWLEKFPEDVQKMREVCDQRWDETLHLLVTGMTTYEAPAPFLKNDGGQLENRRIPDWVPTYSEPDVGKLKNFNPILIFF